MKTLIRYGLFPVNFIGGLLIAYYGISQGWEPAVFLACVFGASGLTLIIAERVNPYYANWNRSKGDVGVDMIHVLVSGLTVPLLVEIGIKTALVGAAAAIAGDGKSSIWPNELHLFLQLPIALIATQFFEYWWHRLAHEVPLFWRFHSIHHSPKRLYWLNAGRFHPIDTTAGVAVSVSTLVLLGANAEVVLLFAVWVTIHGMYQHCNVDVRLGPFNYVFSMAELHRWHHSLVLEEANANYGNNIIFWDIVFGTMYWPKDRQPSEHIGLSDLPEFPETYMGQLLAPVQWDQIQPTDEAPLSEPD